MSYVDGFVLAVPSKKVQAYRRISRRAGRISPLNALTRI